MQRLCRNPEGDVLSQQRHQADAEMHRIYRNPEDDELSQQRHQADADAHREYRNPEDDELSQKRHQANAEEQRLYRNPEDDVLSQQRHQAELVHDHERRLPGKLARAKETEEQALERMQREFDESTETQRASLKTCHASQFFKGKQLIKEHYIGSRQMIRGTYPNRCQHCNDIRYPKEKETLCCKKGKVVLPAVPEPSQILKRLLEGQNPRSNIFPSAK